MNNIQLLNFLTQKKTQRSALHYAAACGCIDVCRAILKRGASPNVIDKNKMTPAHDAAHAGHFEVINNR